MTVALVRYQESSRSIKKAVELCNGFAGLRPDYKVIIKPNLVAGRRRGSPSPGTVTSAAVVDEIVEALQEFGCGKIAIGEGSPMLPEMGFDTPLAFRSAGMAEIASRRGIELIDFNEGPHEPVDFAGIGVRISQHALHADFLINVPVMKTHVQTKVSLGFKNLKGCLDHNSKRKCHDNLELEEAISMLATRVTTHLTVIDGIYGLQYGPMGLDNHRLNTLVVGKDPLSVDTVGAAVLGIDPTSVIHLQEYARRNGRTVDLEAVDIRGEKLVDMVHPLEWYHEWPQELFRAQGVEGLRVDLPGNSNCSGCSMQVFMALDRFAKDNAGVVFDQVEVLIGKETVAKIDSKQVFLAGKCPMFTHRHFKDAIRVKGCPPSYEDLYRALKEHARKGEA
ncbi:MAG: DUF362 domain-containing protein [Dehalococcoidia bacterium]|nr:DUF362 domain-containing protein [Dehalococcoidia bacterium]